MATDLIEIPGMLLVGSAGRNAGKTEFACRLIETFRRERDLVAVKITAVDRTDGACPRGGRGCGVCSSLEGRYAITEETDASGAKDTCRLLAAGATRVLWLRVIKAHMREGLTALLDRIGKDALWICESNSIRRVVRPGVFLMVVNEASDRYKASAEQVRDRVDCFVRSTPESRSFDFDFQCLAVTNDEWTLREDATAVILAGGGSRRMGTDKSLLPVNGRPMIEHIARQLIKHFNELLISAGSAAVYPSLDAPVLADPEPNRGPLMGIATALANASHDVAFVTACDVPDIDMPFVRRMLREAAVGDCDAVVPRWPDGRMEPLHAVYRRRVVPAIHNLLAAGEGRVRALFEHCRVKYEDMPSSVTLTNLNTKEDYGAYCGELDDPV
jgi:molybdopterin-guanine dinucleotide biosynthesis protein A